MEILESPLVFTKYHVSSARPNIIPRGRLLDLLTQHDGKGFGLVSAPAGYGKTTLLVEWAQNQLKKGTAVAWYALDASDDDPIPFGAYLTASLSLALGPTSRLAHLVQLQRVSPQMDLQGLIQSIINLIVTDTLDIILILDDYHLITSPAIHSAITYLLEHLPQNMRVIIGSRSDPPLPLARLRARGNLLEIRAANLRFTAVETEFFLNEVMKLSLSPEGIAVLEERTEGWVTGLQLAGLSLADRADKEGFIANFTGSHRYLVEYLWEEVVNHQSEEVQSFLLATSILERINAPLCDALIGENFQSEMILKRLYQTNLFIIALDEQEHWYRYHHLFRDFLQTRLVKNQPESVHSLHRAACEWLAAHGFLREAAQHAFDTHDWEYAAAFVEKNSFTMIIHSEISTIYEWCSTFPEEVMRMHPLLYIHQCWALVLSFRRQNRARVEGLLNQVELAAAVMQDRQQVFELGESAAVLRTFLAMTPDPNIDARYHLALAQNNLNTYPEGNAGQFSALLTIGYALMALYESKVADDTLEMARQTALHGQLYFGIVESSFHLARLAHSQGKLKCALEICRQGQSDIARLMAHPEQELPALGCLDINIGCVLLEQDKLEDAEDHLLHGLTLMGIGTNPYYLMIAYTTLARLYEIRDRSEEAVMYLTRLEEIWPDIQFYTEGLRINMTLNDFNFQKEAEIWTNKVSSSFGNEYPPAGLGPLGAAEVYYQTCLIWMRMLITISNLSPVWPVLERLINLALTNGLITRVIELSLIEAIYGQTQGNKPQTWKALERALKAAQPEGYIRIFDQGPVLIQMLIEAANKGIYPDYVERILSVIGGRKTKQFEIKARYSTASDLGITETLSERQVEILRLMASGATNQAIAEQLVITVGTVKSHINHILRKLNAHNRTEAVARGREVGLL